MKEIEIIIPVFNEEKNIPLIGEEISKLKIDNIDLLVHYIDDGSNDNSWNLIKDLSKKYKQINGTKLTRNFGKDHAILAGIQNCKSDFALIMDGDFQHPVNFILELIKKINTENCDIVTGNKINQKKGFFRSIYFYVFKKLTKIDLKNNSDFKIINKKVINFLTNSTEKNFFFRGMVEWSGFKLTQIDFKVDERIHGKSKYNFSSLLNIGFNSIFSYSTIPLRLITISGIILLFISGLLFLRTIYLKFFSTLFDGYASLMILILVFLSFLIIAVGVVGEYLAKIYTEIKSRPPYIIYETTKE